MKRIIIFMGILFSLLLVWEMRINGSENIHDSIIIQKGLLKESDLLISGYTIIEGKVDGNSEGTYELLYKDNFSYSTIRKRYIVIDLNYVKDDVEIEVASKLIEKPNNQITEIINLSPTSFFVFTTQNYNNSSYASLSFYNNLNLVWDRSINNFCPNTIKKAYRTSRGILLTGEIINDNNQNVYVCEYNFSGELLNYMELSGEKEEYAKSIFQKGNSIYVIGTTNSQSQDFSKNRYNSFRTFIYMIDYTSFNKEYYELLGNNYNTILLDVIYTKTSIHIINKMSGTEGLHYMIEGGYNAFIISRYDYNMYYEGDINGNCVNIDYNSKFGSLDDSMIVINFSGHKIELMKFDRNTNASLFDHLVYDDEIETVKVYNYDSEVYLNILNKDKTIKNYLINDNFIKQILNKSENDICINYLSNQYLCLQNGNYVIKITLRNYGYETITDENYSITYPMIQVNDLSCDLEEVNETKYKNFFGQIEDIFYYQTKGINIISTMKVSCFGIENIKNNEVYDIGVNLKFIGTGYLNNEPIENNYIINEVGDYILSLFGPSMQKNILFKVRNLQKDNLIIGKENLEITTDNINNKIDEELYAPKGVNFEKSLIDGENNDFINAIYYVVMVTLGFLFSLFVVKKKIFKKITFRGRKIFKIIVLMFFAFLSCKLNLINVEAKTFDIVSKEVNKDSEIFYSNQHGMIYSFEKKVFYSSGKKEIPVPDGENYSILKIKDIIFILYSRQTKLYCFNVNSNISFKVFNFPIIKDYQVQCYNDEIYIGFTTTSVKHFYSNYVSKNLDGYREKDIAIVKLDSQFKLLKANIYGGDKNETLSKIIVNNNGLYLCGFKDCLSYGDFSLAGSLDRQVILLKLNCDLELIEQQIIDKKTEYVDISNYKNYIFLKLDNKVIIFNSYINNETNINEYIFLENEAFIVSKYLVTILSDCFVVRDILIDKEEIIIYDHGNTFIKLSNCIYDKYNNVLIDFVDLQNFRNEVNYYCTNKLNTSISFVCSSVNETQTIPVNQVQPLIWGKYKYIADVKSELFEYDINYYYVIDFEVNVTESLIYPVGYKLLFTGNATLNGESIYNNYSLSKVGSYIIELKSFEGDIKQISFEVQNEQIEIIESYYKGNDFIQCDNYKGTLEFKSKSYEIVGIMIDKNLVEDIQKKGDCFFIPINLEGEVVKRVYVEYLLVEYMDELIEYPIYKEYVFKNINTSPQIKGEINVENCLSFIVEDKNTIRCLEVVAIHNNKEIRKKYAISDKNLIIDGLSVGQNYQIKINLLYEVGFNQLLEYPLVNIPVKTQRKTLELGDFKVESYNGSLRRFSLNFDKVIDSKEINKICIEEKVLITTDDQEINSIIIRCVILFTLSTTLCLVLFKIFPKAIK